MSTATSTPNLLLISLLSLSLLLYISHSLLLSLMVANCILQYNMWQFSNIIINNASCHQNDQCVPFNSESSDGTSYRLTEICTQPVAKAMGRMASIPPLLCAWEGVTYTHRQNDTCIILFTGAAVMLSSFTQCLARYIPFSCLVPHLTSPLLLYIGCNPLPIYH